MNLETVYNSMQKQAGIGNVIPQMRSAARRTTTWLGNLFSKKPTGPKLDPSLAKKPIIPRQYADNFGDLHNSDLINSSVDYLNAYPAESYANHAAYMQAQRNAHERLVAGARLVNPGAEDAALRGLDDFTLGARINTHSPYRRLGSGIDNANLMDKLYAAKPKGQYWAQSLLQPKNKLTPQDWKNYFYRIQEANPRAPQPFSAPAKWMQDGYIQHGVRPWNWDDVADHIMKLDYNNIPHLDPKKIK